MAWFICHTKYYFIIVWWSNLYTFPLSRRPVTYPPPIQPDCLAFFHTSSQSQGLSQDASTAMLRSIASSSLSAYKQYWKFFHSYVDTQGYLRKITSPVICNFLLSMYKKGFLANWVNVIHSALSFFLSNYLDIGTHSHIIRLFKYFYRSRPIRPKYLTFSPVAKQLNFLAKWHTIHELSLKQLTLKTVALVALSSSDRGQTLKLLNIENNHLTEDYNVCDIWEVKNFNTQCHNANAIVTTATIAHWLTSTLALAGIDTKQYTAHS